MSTSMQACPDIAQSPIDAPSSILVSNTTFGKNLHLFLFLLICQLTQAQKTVLKFLRYLLPIISPSHSSSTSGYIMKKVK